MSDNNILISNEDKKLRLSLKDKDYDVKLLDLREFDSNVVVEFTQSDYFKHTAAKNITIASFGIANRFFLGLDSDGNKIDFSNFKGGEIGYDDMVSLIYKMKPKPSTSEYNGGSNNIGIDHSYLDKIKEHEKSKKTYNDAKKGMLALSHYNTDTAISNYAKNALVFGSAEIQIDKSNVRFYIDSNGNPAEIRNFSFYAAKDNYDYKSRNISKWKNHLVKTALRDLSNATTEIKIYEDRGDNRFITVNRQQFNEIKKKTPKINNEEMDMHKLLVRAGEIGNSRFHVIETNNPSFSLGSPYSVDYIRKPNMLSSYKYVYDPKLLEGFIKASESLDKLTVDLEKQKTVLNTFSLTKQLEVKKEKDSKGFDHFYIAGGHYLGLNAQRLNKSTETKDLAAAAIATDDMQPERVTKVANHAIALEPFYRGGLDLATRLNRAQGSTRKTAIDPLILDLNGDGVQAVGYNESPVLFDIDNDGGSLEETGWVSNQDGLLVRDLNNNGKIDNMSEVFSEYYAGRAGRNGEAGEKRFANGFEALKTLDSSNDNLFDSQDRDFNAVRVWQDKNHNGITDSGELLTLSSLGINSIDLNYQNAGGQLFFGNELLAQGYFTRNGKRHEAAAVSFLANPRGHTITKVNGGKKTLTEGAGVLAKTSSFTAEGNQNRDLDAKKLGVVNIQAGNGNDILRGDAQNNWLSGGGVTQDAKKWKKAPISL